VNITNLDTNRMVIIDLAKVRTIRVTRPADGLRDVTVQRRNGKAACRLRCTRSAAAELLRKAERLGSITIEYATKKGRGLGKDVAMVFATCSDCCHVYDPRRGDPTQGIARGTAFEDLPDGWTCPKCRTEKRLFVRHQVKNPGGKWECKGCGYIFDPAVGERLDGVGPSTPFECMPNGWVCPHCGGEQNGFIP